MKSQPKAFAIGLDSKGYEASLIGGNVYRAIPDTPAAKDNLMRVIEESGEDYLYGTDQFIFVDFPPAVRKKIVALADSV